MSLIGQTAIITGAGRGIGRAIALALGEEGMKVGLVARSSDQLDEVADLVNRGPGEALAVPCDIGDAKVLIDCSSRLIKSLGSVDCLINNAAVFVEKGVTELSFEDWERSLAVNLTAPFLLCKQILPYMASNGGGRIINVASTAAHQGYLNQSAYCASKHGLLGFARALAIEAKPHKVHVHTLCPGGVDTDLVKGTYLGQRLEGESMLQPDDIARQVVFLLQQPGHMDIPEIITKRFT